MSRPFPSRSPSPGSYVRINGKIRAREVRVVGADGRQVGVLALHEAISMARANSMDLVEVAPNATPPVCRIVDYGKYRYEIAKKSKESKKHQHSTRVKEIQLSASIDPHDYSIKLGHAVDFLCEEMKVKISLRFRGREMAHQEFGKQVVERLLKDVGPYGQPDAPPKLVNRGLNVMVSPLPRNKRAKNPNLTGEAPVQTPAEDAETVEPLVAPELPAGESAPVEPEETDENGGTFNNPFAQLDVQLGQRPAA